MRKSTRPIVIASRRSRLAQTQAQMVGERLGRSHPKLDIQYIFAESEGDTRLDIALADSGGKGLFASAIERVLLDKRADLAVHSFKDLPSEDTPGLTIAAVMPREDVRDCLITHHSQAQTIADLPQGATIGTASPRRAAQLRNMRPDFQIDLIRGNVDTRLRKVLEDKRHDATLLAMAGLIRLDMVEHLTRPINCATMLPAACQGALAIQCRQDDHVTLSRCLPVNHSRTAICVHAERLIVSKMRGDCHSPIAVLAEPADVDGEARYRMRVRAMRPDGGEIIDVDQTAPAGRFDKMVKQVIGELKQRGAPKLIRGK